jgi:DnaJ domain
MFFSTPMIATAAAWLSAAMPQTLMTMVSPAAPVATVVVTPTPVVAPVIIDVNMTTFTDTLMMTKTKIEAPTKRPFFEDMVVLEGGESTKEYLQRFIIDVVETAKTTTATTITETVTTNIKSFWNNSMTVATMIAERFEVTTTTIGSIIMSSYTACAIRVKDSVVYNKLKSVIETGAATVAASAVDFITDKTTAGDNKVTVKNTVSTDLVQDDMNDDIGTTDDDSIAADHEEEAQGKSWFTFLLNVPFRIVGWGVSEIINIPLALLSFCYFWVNLFHHVFGWMGVAGCLWIYITGYELPSSPEEFKEQLKEMSQIDDKFFSFIPGWKYIEARFVLLGWRIVWQYNSPKAIKKAYRSLSLKYHPDKFREVQGGLTKEEARELYQSIMEAYELLTRDQ